MSRALRSMTGYGRGVATTPTHRYVVELRSVNHRFLELKTRLPWNEPAVEAQLTQKVRARLERGAVSAAVREESGAATDEVRIDKALAKSYAAALTELGRELGLDGAATLAMVVAQPGVVSVGQQLTDPDALWAALAPAVDAALDGLVDARTREGARLREDLTARTATLSKLATEIGALAEHAPEQARQRLTARLDRALAPSDVAIDPQRLAQEVALLADKLDVTEELTRLAAHIDELSRLFDADGANGRRLEFLTQEVNREINTIGSKSQSAEIARRVIDAKAELERLREQIQNLE